jgi:hypothetical protein
MSFHLHATFILITILTSIGFKKFSDEIGVIATHKNSTIEWNGMICCFWKWKPHFNLVEQLGAKLSLLHAIKV